MFGKKLRALPGRERFHLRGKEIVRIEALSDAVFAFSVSLLVAALEVPQTFEELIIIVKGALPFFATVAILFLLWYQQYTFFRYYGLNDAITILLNLAYLALILFYLYPLKFLFSLLLGSWTGINLFPKASEKGLAVISNHDFPYLIILFGIGYFFIWLLIFLMYSRAAHYSNKMQLNRYEILITNRERRGALWNSLVAVASIFLALLGTPFLSGICYLFIPLLLFINLQVFKRQLKKTQPPVIVT
ncbi:MAG TPA: TMEM175 family protein [Ferruginibacter sp.]|nr:TMEM175 family protein [Ferruginibacter sp.]